MKIAWRLTHRSFQEQAMSGNGGLFAAGRWHHRGRRIVYCADSLALATLELFVNLQDKEMLTQYVKSRLSIPRDLIVVLDPQARDAFLRGSEHFDSAAFGTAWLAAASSCVLEVPSRVIPEEVNFLLNPLHPEFNRITAVTDSYQADKRLIRQGTF